MTLGDHGNQWLRGDLDLELSADQEMILQVIIEGHIDGDGLTNDYKSDMAIDDILIFDRGSCSQNAGNLTQNYTVTSHHCCREPTKTTWNYIHQQCTQSTCKPTDQHTMRTQIQLITIAQQAAALSPQDIQFQQPNPAWKRIIHQCYQSLGKQSYKGQKIV